MRAFREYGVSLSAYDIQKQLPGLRKEYSWIADAASQSLKEEVNNVAAAYEKFFSGSGFPNFKRKRGGGSFQCPWGRMRVDFEKSTLAIPKIKDIPIVVSRRFDGQIRRIAIIRTPTNKYFASIIVKTLDKCNTLPKPTKAIGIDLGITNFVTLSSGEKVSNPKHLNAALIRLSVLQRRSARKKKGSNNRRKANLIVARLHEKISNKRNDFLHKLSTRLIRDSQTDTICIEDLSVKNLVKNRSLSRSISDASWSEFVRQLQYKGEWYGKNVIKVNRFYASSKICSNCGRAKDVLNLSERTWDCSNCGASHDRDINAAINIRNSGMGSPGEPVESSSIDGAEKQEFDNTNGASWDSPKPYNPSLRLTDKQVKRNGKAYKYY